MLSRFRRRFWQPPRAHGDVVEDRSVSFLELFYDLVYVVVIARAAHHLAAHVTWRGVAEFAVVFGLIWIGWLNGTIYHDLHGREDGRTRAFVFAQMLLLALVAVFTADAGGDTGAAFALSYAAFLGVVTWLWYSVRRQDSEEYMSITGQYLAGMVVSLVIITASAPLPDTARLIVWGLYVVGWWVGVWAFVRSAAREPLPPLSPSESLIERFGLFTIIVLGEVVVGVVTGLSEAERDITTIATGLIGLMIGFGIWWTYFDFVSSREPIDARIVRWQAGHLPMSLAIAASGAAMVSLVEHAGDGRSPAPTAWLLGGSVALALVSLIMTMTALTDFDRFASVFRPLAGSMAAGAGAALAIAWWRPVPWLMVLLLVAVLSAIWLVAVNRSWISLDDPKSAYRGA